MAKQGNTTTLENGLQVWLSLKLSGLEEARKNELPGYDAELVETLKSNLFPLATKNLEYELQSSPPSTERFLEVFFNATKPFSQMLREVLNMYENAGARRSDENLQIAFDFNKASKSLSMTLQEFRDAEAFFRKVMRPVVERLWNNNTLWPFRQILQDVLESIGAADKNGSASKIRDPKVRAWVEANGRPAWLPFPGFPRSSHQELDNALGAAEELIEFMYEEIQKLGATYEEFTRGMRELPWKEDEAEAKTEDVLDDRPDREFVSAAHDFWANSFAKLLCLGIEAVNERTRDDKTAAARQLAKALQKGFDLPPKRERTILSLEQDFRDLVNLPIWKKRHELYAVWVAGRIAEALHEFSWEWHPDGDTLRFPFSGVELATFRSNNGETHIFWTEKRTALTKPGMFGRKNIQPDYRIMTVPTHRDEATSLVVECKQYRKWSKKNFGAALDDYAAGCPIAPVILVNYGPTDPGILDLVAPSRRDRTFLVGDFRPGKNAALKQFKKLVKSAYSTPIVTRNTGALVGLRWGPEFKDLDLHLFIRLKNLDSHYHVGLNSADGSLLELPWARWLDDVTSSPPGMETTVISRWLNAEYEVWVHDYSGIPSFPNGDVTMQISVLPDGGQYHFSPGRGNGRWWFACRIQGPSGKIEEVNKIHLDRPIQLT